MMETLVGIAIGIGLSAACGFRVFVPLLIMNLAALTGHLQLGSGFEWIGSYYATIAFATATAVEILAYYIPWLDHLLDLLASPLAVIAGIVATASVVTDLSPFLKWTLALIAGGGIAGIIQGGTSTLRLKSSALTGGAGNPLVATGELAGSVITALLALLLPLVCLVLILLLYFFLIRKVGRFLLRPRGKRSGQESGALP
jgi:hypothetical protein